MYWIRIYYATDNIPTIRRIQERFSLPQAMTVNNEWYVWVHDKDMELLREVERRGFIRIRSNNIGKFAPTQLLIDFVAENMKYVAKQDVINNPEVTPELISDYIMSEVGRSTQSYWDYADILKMIANFRKNEKD